MSVQDIINRDGDRPAGSLVTPAGGFIGDADIPFERYTSRQFYDLEMQRMWSRVWQWACREEHIPEVGDYYVYDIGRYSLIVVRTQDGIRAYHNSCLHRGTRLKPSGFSGRTLLTTTQGDVGSVIDNPRGLNRTVTFREVDRENTPAFRALTVIV